MTATPNKYVLILGIIAALWCVAADAPIQDILSDHQFELPKPKNADIGASNEFEGAGDGPNGTASGESAESAEPGSISGEADNKLGEADEEGGESGATGEPTSEAGEPGNADGEPDAQTGEVGAEPETGSAVSDWPGDEGSTGQGIRSSTKPALIDFEFPEPDYEYPDLDFPTPDWAAIIPIIRLLIACILLGTIILMLRRMFEGPSPTEIKKERTILDDLRSQAGGNSYSDSAAREDYVAAVHAMLLEIFETLEPRVPIISRPATTSREIVGHIEDSELALSIHRLVHIVEGTRFASKVLDQPTYQSALEAFENASSKMEDA